MLQLILIVRLFLADARDYVFPGNCDYSSLISP